MRRQILPPIRVQAEESISFNVGFDRDEVRRALEAALELEPGGSTLLDFKGQVALTARPSPDPDQRFDVRVSVYFTAKKPRRRR